MFEVEIELLCRNSLVLRALEKKFLIQIRKRFVSPGSFVEASLSVSLYDNRGMQILTAL